MDIDTVPGLIQECQVERSRQGVGRPVGESGGIGGIGEEVRAWAIGIVVNPLRRKGLIELPKKARISSTGNRIIDGPNLCEGRLDNPVSIPIRRGRNALEACNRSVALLARFDLRPPGMTSLSILTGLTHMASSAVLLLMLGNSRRIYLRDTTKDIFPCIPAPKEGPAFKVMRILETIYPGKSCIRIGIRINSGIRLDVEKDG